MAPKPKAKINPGGRMKVARAPKPKAKINPGGPMRHPAPRVKAKVNPGGPMKTAPKAKRTAAGLIVPGYWIAGQNNEQPSCVATAIANSLLAIKGVRATDDQVLRLHRHAGGDDGVRISDALASVMQSGLAGYRPSGYWLTGYSGSNGLIVGLSDGVNDHAATLTYQGLISWGAPLDAELAQGWLYDGESWCIDW
jgi:hypothetical protein